MHANTCVDVVMSHALSRVCVRACTCVWMCNICYFMLLLTLFLAINVHCFVFNDHIYIYMFNFKFYLLDLLIVIVTLKIDGMFQSNFPFTEQ